MHSRVECLQKAIIVCDILRHGLIYLDFKINLQSLFTDNNIIITYYGKPMDIDLERFLKFKEDNLIDFEDSIYILRDNNDVLLEELFNENIILSNEFDGYNGFRCYLKLMKISTNSNNSNIITVVEEYVKYIKSIK